MRDKFKAVYYERVSTGRDEQTESLENQRKLCENYLKRHPGIELAEPIDTYSERVSGKSDVRPKYSAMIQRIEEGDIDFLMVKDLKRLSRSTEVSSQLRNLVKQYQFRFILLATSQIYDPTMSETRLMFGFESLVNEEVVFRQSEYGRIAHRQKMEAKKLTKQNITFGYCWDDKKADIAIDEEKAAIIRKMFDLYVFRNYGTKQIRQFLEERNLAYSAVTVRKWLQETAYIGTFHMNKKGSELGVGTGQKTKRFFLPEEDWVSVERPDLAIVEKEVFDLAQRIRASRKKTYAEDKNGVRQARFEGTHLFSGKVICGECGSPYTHCFTDRKKSVGAYRDSFNHKRGNASLKCGNKLFSRVSEKDLKTIVTAAINQVIMTNKGCFSVLLSAIEKVLSEGDTMKDEIHELRRRITSIKRSKSKTKVAYTDAVDKGRTRLADELWNDYEKYVAQQEAAESELNELLETELNEQALKDRMAKIKAVIDELQVVRDIDRTTIQEFVDRIMVHGDGEMEILLKTGEKIKDQLDKERAESV